MPRVALPFARSYTARSEKTVSSERLINWYAQPVETHGKQQYVLNQRPGLSLVSTLSIGPHRGMLEHDGALYMVSSNLVYKMDTTETFTVVCNLNTYTGRVGLASNGTQLIIVDGQDGWIWDTVTLICSQITDLDFVDARQVVFLHGYFIVNRPGTGRFYISALYDGLTWAALDYATAELDPDDLLALAVTHQELVLFGEYTAEFFADTGNILFAFENNPGGAIDWGIAAPWSIAKGDNTLLWLAKTRDGQASVVKATGFSPKVISNNALEQAMSGYSRIDDAIAFTVKAADQSLFYVLTFPTGNATWVYDFTTDFWHQWSSYGVGRFRCITHAFFNNKHYMGSSSDGKLYWFNPQMFTDDTDPLVRTVSSVHISYDLNRIFWHSLEALFEEGVGLYTGQGSDPQAMLRWSDDGGHTFGNSHWRSIGKIGEYKNRAIWRRLGTSLQHRVYELSVSDPVKATVIGFYANLTPGS